MRLTGKKLWLSRLFCCLAAGIYQWAGSQGDNEARAAQAPEKYHSGSSSSFKEELPAPPLEVKESAKPSIRNMPCPYSPMHGSARFAKPLTATVAARTIFYRWMPAAYMALAGNPEQRRLQPM